jgi:hypothetical protein
MRNRHVRANRSNPRILRDLMTLPDGRILPQKYYFFSETLKFSSCEFFWGK